MQKKTLIRLGFTSIVLVSSLLLLGTGAPKKTPALPEKKATCCKKTPVQNCPVKTDSQAPSDLILGNLSNQFISISSFY